MRFHILDTETIGFKPPQEGSGICEVSVREVDENFNELAHYYARIDPEAPISAGATATHGIRNEDVEDEPTLSEWLGLVLEQDIWSAGKEPFFLIAHNAAFDEKFLSGYLHCDYHLVDTLVLARRYYPDAESHKLQVLRVLLDLPFDITDAHSAAGDTQSLLHFMTRLSIDTGMSLVQLCADSMIKDPITKFPFGKHKGKLIADVAKSDKGYIRWCLNKMENLQPDMREALEAAIA